MKAFKIIILCVAGSFIVLGLGCYGIYKLAINVANSQEPLFFFEKTVESAKRGDYRMAAMYHTTAIAYGLYDMKRVSDKTSHQCIPIIRSAVLKSLTKEEKEKTQKAIQALDESSVQNWLATIGSPSYYPKYMVAHGINPPKEVPPQGFDPEVAWQESIDEAYKLTRPKNK
jgi:hypothetical protein